MISVSYKFYIKNEKVPSVFMDPLDTRIILTAYIYVCTYIQI